MTPRHDASAANRHVALLRGVNLGRRRLSMQDLARVFTEAGCRDVSTYIQSGNVIFTATPSQARRLAKIIPEAIATRFGFDVPVIVRSAAELEKIARGNPFVARGCEPKWLHVSFLAGPPATAAAVLLDPRRSPPDEFVLRGAEIYLHLPNGMARSKLTNAYFDSTLDTVSSARNWNTVLALLELARRGGSEGERRADAKRPRR